MGVRTSGLCAFFAVECIDLIVARALLELLSSGQSIVVNVGAAMLATENPQWETPQKISEYNVACWSGLIQLIP